MKEQLKMKGVYLTSEQIKKVEKIRKAWSTEAKAKISFSTTVAKIIEERK